MSVALAGLVILIALVAVAVWWWRHARAAAVLVSAEPEAALLTTAAALRRLGARITRYDGEVGTLEAQVPESSARVRVRITPEDEQTTRVHLEGDRGAAGVIRRFRDAISA
jgi:hypothetical protein